MSVSVTMPRLGESVTEGTVTRWLKKEGDQVAVDEPLLEVSTDKVDTEIPSPVAGILSKITVAEDETVEVGSELAVIDDGPAHAAPEQTPTDQATTEQTTTEQTTQPDAEVSAPRAAEAPAPGPEAVAPEPAAPAPAAPEPAAPVIAEAPPTPPPPAPAPAPTATPAPASKAATSPPAPPAPSPPPIGSTEKFVAANVPFVGDKTRTSLASEYAGATDFKAFALNVGAFSGWVTAQPSEEAARTAAVELCQKRADAALSPRKCELYAVGDYVVYAHGKPPVPPQPWVRHDAVTEQPFVSKDVPLTRDPGKARFESGYVPGRKIKTIALGPGGAFFFLTAMDSIDEATRRALESCGAIAGVPCMIIALNENFVVPIPTTLRVTGFFKVAGNGVISPEARDDVARQIADATSGWNAVAVGAAGRPGLGLKAATEQAAVNAALGDCVKRDSDCHVIAIGPFSVGPN